MLLQETNEIEWHLIGTIYDLICQEKYALAINLTEFATEVIKKFDTDEIRLHIMLNKAQAYKWSGNMEECLKILHSVD